MLSRRGNPLRTHAQDCGTSGRTAGVRLLRGRLLPLLLLLALAVKILCAETTVPPQDATDSIVDRAHADEWSSDINTGWLMREGDDHSWARPGLDDSGWQTVDLGNLGRARPGWLWYRLHLTLHEDHPDLALLIEGGVGVYELYINGVQIRGPQLQSSFAVNRPIERTLPLAVPGTNVEIALRTCTPPGYAAWRLPLFMTASLGTPNAIEAQRQALESARVYSLIPSVAINLLLVLAGIGVFSLHRAQREHAEYLWLGLYLFLIGIADLLWYLQAAGYAPLAANVLLADPLLYPVTIAQIEFTFSFGGRRPGRLWRAYQALLLLAPALTWLVWLGKIPSVAYMVTETALLIPVALLLPIMLFVWFRRGNWEASWLILPSLLPAATLSLYDFGTLSIFFGWRRNDSPCGGAVKMSAHTSGSFTRGTPNGSGAAAVLAAGIGAFAIAVLDVAADKVASIKSMMNFYKPTGPLSGVTMVSLILWLLCWAVLEWQWQKKDVAMGKIGTFALVLLVVSLLVTFPPIADFL